MAETWWFYKFFDYLNFDSLRFQKNSSIEYVIRIIKGVESLSMIIRKYNSDDLVAIRAIWNNVVEEGTSFPQDKILTEEQAKIFFAEQTYTGVAEDCGEVVGVYILHPNNVGRCGHIANASYAVKTEQRGKHIGEMLVKDSMVTAASLDFRILQFNAVVATNESAIHLYNKLGFTQLGVIYDGFKISDNVYADIIPFYIKLK